MLFCIKLSQSGNGVDTQAVRAPQTGEVHVVIH